jgi:hypothetical protein
VDNPYQRPPDERADGNDISILLGTEKRVKVCEHTVKKVQLTFTLF